LANKKLPGFFFYYWPTKKIQASFLFVANKKLSGFFFVIDQ